MWHLRCGNRARNGNDRNPETGKTFSLKPCTFENSYRSCAVIVPRGYALIHYISTKDSDSTGGFCYTQTMCSSSVSSLIPQCSVLYCTLSIGIFKVQLLVNAFGVFRAFYRGHFSYDFRAQGVTSKSKALATKCIFHIYSQLLDICTRLVLKTAEELSVIFRVIVTSKNPCYAQATWDWICLKKKQTNKESKTKKQNKTKQKQTKQKIKN